MHKNKNKKISVLFTIILFLVFLTPNLANAGWFTDWLGGTLFNASIGQILTGLSGFVINLVGEAITWAAGLLDSWVQYMPVSGVFFVNESWKILRNFVNMLFILVLIIMAFGTIFDIQRYTWKDMLPKFIIAALLINFSLAIGQYIVGVANGLASVFLTQIGNVSAAFGDGLRLKEILKPEGSGAILDSAGNLVITAIFGIIFLVVTFLALISTAFFVLARTVVIWFLLIVSPLAWFGYTLPNLRAKTWSNWWNHFLCWCFFLPYYLFFLMFAIIFIGNKDKVPLPSAAATGSVLNQSLSVNTLLMYSISLVFLMGGLYYAKKWACESGNYVGAAFGRIEAGVRKYAPRAAYVRGAVAGVKERAEEIGEKGVRVPFTGGYRLGGAAGAREAEARAKGWFAPGPTTGEREARKQEATEIDKEVKRLRELNLTLDELNKRISGTKGHENVAALKLKAESGWLETGDKQKVKDTIRSLGGTDTVSGAAFVSSLQRGDFERLFTGPEDKKQFVESEDMNTRELLGLKKALLVDMANGRELFDEDLIAATIKLHKTDSKEIQDKAREAAKKSLDNLALGKTTKEKEALLGRLEVLDKDLARSFAMSMAEDKDVMEEGMFTRILDMYKDQSVADQAKVEKALRENVQNFAKKKDDRKALLLDQRRDADGNTIKTDPRIKKMLADLMIDKKEVNELKLREETLDLIGRGTAAERDASKRINSINPLLDVEAKVRKEMGITSLDSELSAEGNERVLNELAAELDKISKDEFGKLKQMSGDFYKDPRFKEAIQKVLTRRDEMSQLFRDAPRDLKSAIKDLPGAVRAQRERQPRQAPPVRTQEEKPRIQQSTTFEKPTATPEEEESFEAEREKAREYLRQQGKL